MKRYGALCLAAVILLSVCGCADPGVGHSSDSLAGWADSGAASGWSSGASGAASDSHAGSPEGSGGVDPDVSTDQSSGAAQGSAPGTDETAPGQGASDAVPAEAMSGVTSGAVRVRSGPGTNYSSIAALEEGESVVILSTMNGWHQIRCGEIEGYAAVQYITLTDMPDTDGHVIADTAQPELFPLAKSYSFDREVEAEYVMIHFISGVVLDPKDPYNMDTIREIFLNNGLSVNYIIERDGTVACYVPEDRAAYHAGIGNYGGDERLTNKMNQYAIGIELAAIGSASDMAGFLSAAAYKKLDPALIGYTDAQYEALKVLVADICRRNNIPMDREHVIGHEDYNSQKTDPGQLFDWDRLLG